MEEKDIHAYKCMCKQATTLTKGAPWRIGALTPPSTRGERERERERGDPRKLASYVCVTCN